MQTLPVGGAIDAAGLDRLAGSAAVAAQAGFVFPLDPRLLHLVAGDHHLLQLAHWRKLWQALARATGNGADGDSTTQVETQAAIKAAIDSRLPVIGQAMHTASGDGVDVGGGHR